MEQMMALRMFKCEFKECEKEKEQLLSPTNWQHECSAGCDVAKKVKTGVQDVTHR